MIMVATVLSIDAIVSDPQIRRGRPSIAGRSITVSDLVARYLRWGTTPEELASQFALTMGQVYAALSYYYTHQAEIDEEMRRDLETADRLKIQLEQQGKLGHLD
jgi:uncharacterized protein (DUF433 family)